MVLMNGLVHGLPAEQAEVREAAKRRAEAEGSKRRLSLSSLPTRAMCCTEGGSVGDEREASSEPPHDGKEFLTEVASSLHELTARDLQSANGESPS